MNETVKTDDASPGLSKFILAGVIVFGAFLGLASALLVPADWLFVPDESPQTAREDGTDAGKNPKEFYA